MKTSKLIELLESQIGDPTLGLPEEVFLFASRITPMICVDLLIKDSQKRTLLTWRDDGHYPPGWHVPGGIVRYKEKLPDRVRHVAANELGAKVNFKPLPLAINEIIDPSRSVRGHSIAFLYDCRLTGAPDQNIRYKKGVPKPGEWAWHDGCPDDLIPVHEIYRGFI